MPTPLGLNPFYDELETFSRASNVERGQIRNVSQRCESLLFSREAKMRTIAVLAAAAVSVLALSSGAASSEATPKLSGKMIELQYLVGTWTCTTKVPANGKMRAQTISAKSFYWVEPENVIGTYYKSKPYSSSGFMGWSDSKKLWWSNGSDVYGAASILSGKGSGTNIQVLTGTNWYQGQTSTSRDTMTKTSDTNYSDFFEILQGGKVTFQGTSECTKASNKVMM